MLHDLMQDPITNPYTIEALLPSLGAAQASADKLAKLKLSDEVLTLNSFLPDGQTRKLALIQDAAGILGPTLAPPDHPPATSAGAFRNAALTCRMRWTGLRPDYPPMIRCARSMPTSKPCPRRRMPICWPPMWR